MCVLQETAASSQFFSLFEHKTVNPGELRDEAVHSYDPMMSVEKLSLSVRMANTLFEHLIKLAPHFSNERCLSGEKRANTQSPLRAGMKTHVDFPKSDSYFALGAFCITPFPGKVLVLS